MDLFDQIRKISFLFFAAIGIAHFTAGFFAVNGYFAETASVANRELFIPFVLATLTYGFSNLKYHLLENGNNSKTLDYVFIGFGAAAFFSLIAIEFFIADSLHPLVP